MMDNANYVNGQHVNELLQAQLHIWNHIFNFMNSMSLKCAIDLGIPDIIQNHAKPMTLTEFVAALPKLNPHKACNIDRLLSILVHSGFFARQKLGRDDSLEDGYVLTGASRLLLKNHPLNQTPFLKLAWDLMSTNTCHFLGNWFQNNDPTAFETTHGKSLWDYFSHDPQLSNVFNEGLTSDSGLVTSVLINKCKGAFEGLDSLVDVGGSTGTVARAIANALPHMECTVLDLPHVVDGLKDSGNLKFVGGDLFAQVPTADAVLLKVFLLNFSPHAPFFNSWPLVKSFYAFKSIKQSILHDWNDEECLKILILCKNAISSGDKEKGKLIIIDMVLKKNDKVSDEGATSNLIETQLCVDMWMMVFSTGRERQEEEWAKLFSDAGFSDYKITPIFRLRSLIEVYP